MSSWKRSESRLAALKTLAGMGLLALTTGTALADNTAPAGPAPAAVPEDANRLGCKIIGESGQETEVGFWPCVQAWVYADFEALHEGEEDQVPAFVVAQMKSNDLSDRMGRIIFDNWAVERVEQEGEDFLRINGWGFKKNGYQMQMENMVPFKSGETMTEFTTTTPDGSQSTVYQMQCYLDLEGIE